LAKSKKTKRAYLFDQLWTGIEELALDTTSNKAELIDDTTLLFIAASVQHMSKVTKRAIKEAEKIAEKKPRKTKRPAKSQGAKKARKKK
jgi:hypothetical protein